MATLKEIAAKAGVHLTTVSGILNQSQSNSRSSDATRKKVLRIAQNLGYVRNQLASRLRSQRTHTICLIAGDIRNPFFATLATAIEEELEARGYQLLLLCRGLGEGRPNAEVLRDVFEQPVDGFIVWSESAGKTVRQLPENFPKPVVTIGAPVTGFPGVKLDIGRGLKMAVDYLASKGHRHLAYYAPEEARLKGLPQPRPQLFDKIVTKAGLPRPQVIFYPGQDWDVAAAANYASQAQLNPDITALVGFNDVSILGWLQAKRVRSVETVSFDGTDWLRLSGNAIPHVYIPARKLAHAAVATMLAHFETRAAKIPSPVVLSEFLPL